MNPEAVSPISAILDPASSGDVACFNSESFRFFLDRELAESNRYGYFSGVALFRVDVSAPEESFSRLIRCLGRNVRKTDFLGVFDSRTIAVVLQHASIENALRVLERLKDEVSRMLSGQEGADIRAAVAVFPTEANTLDELTSLAERRLAS